MGDGERDIRENLVVNIFEKKTDLSLIPSSLVLLQDETGEYHQDLQELYSQSLPFQSLYHYNHSNKTQVLAPQTLEPVNQKWVATQLLRNTGLQSLHIQNQSETCCDTRKYIK